MIYDEGVQRGYFLTVSEMQLARIEGIKRQRGKELSNIPTNKADDGKSDAEIHIFGAIGELAVCRLLGLEPCEQWSRHEDYSHVDDGKDLMLPNGRTIDVKTRQPGRDFAMNPGRGETDFKADYGVLVWLEKRNATIVGGFDKTMWHRDSGVICFGAKGNRWGFKGKLKGIKQHGRVAGSDPV